MKKAIALYSGGMDSALAVQKMKSDYQIIGAFFNVGQPGVDYQLASARRLATWQDIHLEVFDLSSLKNNFLGLADKNQISMSVGNTINCPFGIFGLASTYAISRRANALVAGVHKDDLTVSQHAGQFLKNVAEDASKLHNIEFEMCLPFLNTSKADVIRYGIEINFPLGYTRSCSESNEHHCGSCDECKKRKIAFSTAGVNDPTQYAE
ncbi:7-cyano-7-deazaguanine synthase [Undibacterium sp. TC9W]|uniref:7-cyano-7-deazaguanine synthase n=1 Tax=Undibacterium sp. TC9W TaxID=3413053 RepID=UPI003BF07644